MLKYGAHMTHVVYVSPHTLQKSLGDSPWKSPLHRKKGQKNLAMTTPLKRDTKQRDPMAMDPI